MAIYQTKKISPVKALFLSLCLVGGEIGYETVRLLKKDYGAEYIKSDVIHRLVKSGYILKVGSNSDYGYVLTPAGFEYLKIKYPDTYVYSIYSLVPANVKSRVRERNHRLSLLLYTFYRNGIEFGSHYGEAFNIMNGISKVYVDKPFFVAAKEMRSINKRLATTVGSRFYGCLFTSEGVTVVYSPDEEHQLNAGFEDKFYGLLTTTLEQSYLPYRNKENLRALFIFKNGADMVSQYVVKPEQTNKRSTSTKRVLLKNPFVYNSAYILNSNAYSFSDILYKYNRSEIDKVFYEYYYLERYKFSVQTTFVDGIYRDENFKNGIMTVLLWDLDPSKLAKMSRYIQENNCKMLICCFAEQKPLIEDILRRNRKVFSYTTIAGLPKDKVYKYLRGEIDEID